MKVEYRYRHPNLRNNRRLVYDHATQAVIEYSVGGGISRNGDIISPTPCICMPAIFFEVPTLETLAARQLIDQPHLWPSLNPSTRRRVNQMMQPPHFDGCKITSVRRID